MNLTLATLAVLATLPAIRARVALGDPRDDAAIRAALAAVAGVVAVTIVLLPAIVRAADISAPTARIAAGLVIAVTSVPDGWRRPVLAAPSEPRWRRGLVPVAVPEVFAPPLAAAVTAATIDLGLAVAFALGIVAVSVLAVAVMVPGPRTAGRAVRGAMTARAALALGLGIALVMNGIYDI
jgi:small neutral amino acid transporter SnatA (MarC family)